MVCVTQRKNIESSIKILFMYQRNGQILLKSKSNRQVYPTIKTLSLLVKQFQYYEQNHYMKNIVVLLFAVENFVGHTVFIY